MEIRSEDVFLLSPCVFILEIKVHQRGKAHLPRAGVFLIYSQHPQNATGSSGLLGCNWRKVAIGGR
jgi:hypothetical protein